MPKSLSYTDLKEAMAATNTPVVPPPQQEPSRLSKWVNRFLALFFFVLLPVAYFFGFINTNWVNRIGIVMNFCAGLMVAPELLGEKRLRRFESFLEHVSEKITSFEPRALQSLKVVDRSFRITRTEGATVIVFSIAVVSYFGVTLFGLLGRSEQIRSVIILTVFYVLATIAALTFYPFVDYVERIRKRDGENIKFFLLGGLFTMFIAPLVLLYVIIAPLLVMVGPILLWPISRLATTTTRTLAGDERLRVILISWGVPFYILGNLLQLLSTF